MVVVEGLTEMTEFVLPVLQLNVLAPLADKATDALGQMEALAAVTVGEMLTEILAVAVPLQTPFTPLTV